VKVKIASPARMIAGIAVQMISSRVLPWICGPSALSGVSRRRRRLDEDEDDRAEAEDDPVETRDRLPARGVRARGTETPGSRERGPRGERRKHGD